MQLTNKFDLPAPVVRALSFDNYSKGRADFSVTQLIDSPRVRALQWRHDHEIEQDVTDNFFSLLGRACHQILEWGAREEGLETAEERLFLTVDIGGVPFVVSGSMDLQEADGLEGVVISDYKVTSVLSATADKTSWAQQLNLYAHLVRETKNVAVARLQIVVFLRDWRRSSAERDRDYPQSPILVLPIKLWPPKQTARFLHERMCMHVEAGEAVLAGADLAPCTAEERWEGDPIWAVVKPGGKRALKLLDTEGEAVALASLSGAEVQRRGGEPRRCLGNWCKVAAFCDHGRKVRGAENNDTQYR